MKNEKCEIKNEKVKDINTRGALLNSSFLISYFSFN